MRRVRITVHAQIRSIIRVLRSLGPRSEGETAYSPFLVIKAATRKSKRCARGVQHGDVARNKSFAARAALRRNRCLELAWCRIGRPCPHSQAADFRDPFARSPVARLRGKA